MIAWSIDRLGRFLQDLVAFLGDLRAAGVDLYLDRQGIDTTTPGGKALYQMTGVFAGFKRAIKAAWACHPASRSKSRPIGLALARYSC